MANTEKTDLAKILSISGQHGLFKFVAQARGGAIVEALDTGVRTVFGSSSRLSTLEDISIYTDEGEMKLREVFTKMHEALGDADAPAPKASNDDFKALFGKAVPNYDADRFYVSHMKKIALWYNELKNHASLDFVDPDVEQNVEEEAPAEDKSNE